MEYLLLKVFSWLYNGAGYVPGMHRQTDSTHITPFPAVLSSDASESAGIEPGLPEPGFELPCETSSFAASVF